MWGNIAFCKLQTFYGEFSAHVAEIRNFKFGKSISILKLGGEKEKMKMFVFLDVRNIKYDLCQKCKNKELFPHNRKYFRENEGMWGISLWRKGLSKYRMVSDGPVNQRNGKSMVQICVSFYDCPFRSTKGLDNNAWPSALNLSIFSFSCFNSNLTETDRVYIWGTEWAVVSALF